MSIADFPLSIFFTENKTNTSGSIPESAINNKSIHMRIKKLFVFVLIFCFSAPCFPQNSEILKEKENRNTVKDSLQLAKEFIMATYENLNQHSILQLLPTLSDCKKIFLDEPANQYFSYLTKLSQNSKPEKAEKIKNVSVYKFNKSDIIDTSDNSNYRGGGGMRKIIGYLRPQPEINFYGARIETVSGGSITNIFVFNNGAQWKYFPKPWPWSKLQPTQKTTDREELFSMFVNNLKDAMAKKDLQKLLKMTSPVLQGEGDEARAYYSNIFKSKSELNAFMKCLNAATQNNPDGKKMKCNNECLCLYFQFQDGQWKLVDSFCD